MLTDSDAIARLALYRLERDISYKQLADELNDAGFLIPWQTLNRMLTGRVRGQARERTRFKVRRFVELKIVGGDGPDHEIVHAAHT